MMEAVVSVTGGAGDQVLREKGRIEGGGEVVNSPCLGRRGGRPD